MHKKLPLSGSEPLFDEKFYGTPRGIASFNCYAYAINEHKSQPGSKLQPGDLSHQSSGGDSTSCAFLVNRVLADNKRRGIKAVKPAAKCPAGYYKIMTVQDPGSDFHFYRQSGNIIYRMRPKDTIKTVARDFRVPMANIVTATQKPAPGHLVVIKRAGTFSHKQGLATGPLLRDAKGHTIPDPRFANRTYGDLNYTTFCGAMCVRAEGINATPAETNELRMLMRHRLAKIANDPKAVTRASSGTRRPAGTPMQTV